MAHGRHVEVKEVYIDTEVEVKEILLRDICGICLSGASSSKWSGEPRPLTTGSTSIPTWRTTSAVTTFSRSSLSDQRRLGPVFVQRLLVAFRLLQCAWLNSAQCYNVENCTNASTPCRT